MLFGGALLGGDNLLQATSLDADVLIPAFERGQMAKLNNYLAVSNSVPVVSPQALDQFAAKGASTQQILDYVDANGGHEEPPANPTQVKQLQEDASSMPPTPTSKQRRVLGEEDANILSSALQDEAINGISVTVLRGSADRHTSW